MNSYDHIDVWPVSPVEEWSVEEFKRALDKLSELIHLYNQTGHVSITIPQEDIDELL